VIVAGKNFGCGSSREQAAIHREAAGGRYRGAIFCPDIFRTPINVGCAD